MWRRWLRRLTNQKYRGGGIYSRCIGPSLETYAKNPELHRENLVAALAYMTKGASPPAATELGITEPTPTGRVIGKRAGWWQEQGHPDNRDTSRACR
jgi:hypothetical protein